MLWFLLSSKIKGICYFYIFKARNPLMNSFKLQKYTTTILGIVLPLLLLGQHDTELKYANLNANDLNLDYINAKVDSIMWHGIKQHAFPGAQLLVAKNNQIIFHRAYGYHTYDSIQKVGLIDIYDIASVTKITGPLLGMMKLYEEGQLELDVPFSTYWTSWKSKKLKRILRFANCWRINQEWNLILCF